jgi:hypothetical protein
MSAPESNLLSWLNRFGGFPAQRLPGGAELLLCFAAAAEAETGDAPVQNAGPVARRDTAKDAALRQHELRRSRTHFKVDNSHKV